MRCPDCRGSKIYQPFFGQEEKCANCNGTGEVADATGTAVTAVREDGGVIRFSVTPDGRTGSEWIECFKKQGVNVRDYTKRLLLSSDFRPTSGDPIEIAVLKGDLFGDSDRTMENIRAEASRHNLTKLNAEVACLIREQFTDNEIEAMGLRWIIAMHEPIKDYAGNPNLFGAGRNDGCRQLFAYDVGGVGGRWRRGVGFAFVVAQASA